MIFGWYFACLFLLFSASFQLLEICFRSRRAQIAGLCFLAVALAVPVAGTALILSDPYITARSLVVPLSIFAMSAFLGGNVRVGLLWLGSSAAVHPEAIYATALCTCIVLVRKYAASRGLRLKEAAMLLPVWLPFHPATGAYREVLASRPYLNVLHWTWFEWAGVIAPLAIFWFCARLRTTRVTTEFRTLSRAVIPFGVCFCAAAVLLGASSSLDYASRFQPMRCLHLIYALLFLFVGALLGEFVLYRVVWRWCVIFLPLSVSMYMLDAAEYSSSPHVEFPGTRYDSGYLQAFLWIRENTPKDAVFGLDPDYTTQAGVDLHGFGALAERSAPANTAKDSGTVSVFPQLAEQWKQQVTASKLMRSISRQDIESFTGGYGIQWVVVGLSKPLTGWSCPYRNREVKVCRKQ